MSRDKITLRGKCKAYTCNGTSQIEIRSFIDEGPQTFIRRLVFTTASFDMIKGMYRLVLEVEEKSAKDLKKLEERNKENLDG